MVEFMAYTGVRTGENTGLEVGDLVFAPGAGPLPRCTVQVRRTKKRKGGEWVPGTLKSKRSRRDVPVPPWLVAKLADYLADTHPHGDDPTAPLWPSRKNGGGYRAKGARYAVPLDWSQPIALGAFYDTIFKPALEAVGLSASRPATATTPAVRGVRLHDLRHTYAVMHLSEGTHFHARQPAPGPLDLHVDVEHVRRLDPSGAIRRRLARAASPGGAHRATG